jgi:hypothetical protein
MGEQAIPTTWAALIAVVIVGFITPHIVAFVTDKNAPWWLTGPLAAVVAGLGALVTYLTDAKGVGTWKEALGVFFAAVVAAQGYRAGLDPGTVEPLQEGGVHLGHKAITDVEHPAPAVLGVTEAATAEGAAVPTDPGPKF